MRTIEYVNRKGHSFIIMIDDDDFDVLSRFSWHVTVGGYVERSINRGLIDGKRVIEKIKMHRVIVNCPNGLEVDHINGVKTDNRKSNLRVVTKRQNAMNRGKYKNNNSGMTGVRWNEKLGKWVATANDKQSTQKHLGCFLTKEAAGEAYRSFIAGERGEFAHV